MMGKGKREKLISISLTVFVIFLVIFSGPASAVKIAMGTPSGNHYIGDTVTYTVDVTFQHNDLIPITTINVTDLPKGDISFSVDGTQLSGSDDYDVTLVEDTSYYGYGYGYGYGYDHREQKRYRFEFGYGYGYGYGYDSSVSGPSRLRYEIKIRNLPIGTYHGHADIKVNTGPGQHVFSDDQTYSFKVISRPDGPHVGGGSIGSSEDMDNIQNTNTARAYMSEGKTAVFNFGDIVDSIELIPGGNYGLIAGKVENLYGLSSNIPKGKIPEGEIFRYLNIDIGNLGWPDGKLSDIVINFHVPASWFEENNIDPSTVVLYRNHGGEWQALETTLKGEEEGYYQYSSSTPGFSSFAIAAVPVSIDTGITPSDTVVADGVEPSKTTAKKGLPGFEIVVGIVGIFLAAYARKK